jgi:hypothetical protein
MAIKQPLQLPAPSKQFEDGEVLIPIESGIII